MVAAAHPLSVLITFTSALGWVRRSLVDLVSYNEQGQLVRLERGNGVDTAYNYYEFPLSGEYGYDSGRLRTIQHGGTHDPLPDFNYSYDNVGNIDKIETFATPPHNSTLYLDTQTFSYDEQNRLITANGMGQAALSIAAYQEIYDHDLLGNLIQLGHQGQTTLQYSDPAHKQAATHRNGSSTPSYTYDNNGNMTSRVEGSTTYTQLYDAENRLVSVMAGGSAPPLPMTIRGSGSGRRRISPAPVVPSLTIHSLTMKKSTSRPGSRGFVLPPVLVRGSRL